MVLQLYFSLLPQLSAVDELSLLEQMVVPCARQHVTRSQQRMKTSSSSSPSPSPSPSSSSSSPSYIIFIFIIFIFIIFIVIITIIITITASNDPVQPLVCSVCAVHQPDGTTHFW
jgi:hypothetical protein